MIHHRWLAMILALIAFAPNARAIDILRWERLPLPVSLLVDQERVVIVDRPVRVGVPASVDGRLRVQTAGGAVYLRASAPIEATRLQLQDAHTGQIILLDVAAIAATEGQSPLEPVRIVVSPTQTALRRADIDETTDEGVAEHTSPVPVLLTRYAAQSVYAPARVIEPVPGVVRVGIRDDLPLDRLLPTLPVDVAVLGAWRLGDHWVSAVRLRNTVSVQHPLDPRTLQGRFVAATFQHHVLGPAGSPEDTTVVYLVTAGSGLQGALPPSLSPIDAAINLPTVRGGGRDEE